MSQNEVFVLIHVHLNLTKQPPKAHATTKLVSRNTENTVDDASANSMPDNKKVHGDGATLGLLPVP